jgi:hypothetical protein
MARSITPRQRDLFIVFLLALFPAGNALNPRLDEDTWWHLAVGEYVVRNRAVPSEEPFSRLGREEHVPWVAYSWLHEVAMYGAYRAGGLSGILAFRHLLDSLTFVTIALFLLRGTGGGIRPLVALGLVTASLVPMMLERPWHYTIVLTTLTLHATFEMRSGASPRRFWWLIPLFALWANLHIQFVLGFGVLGLGLIATLLERWRAAEPVRCGAWAGLIAACAAATLVNPYHVRLYQVVWEYASQTGAMQLVVELHPPNFRHWWNWALAILLIWAGVECVEQRFPVFETALFVVAAVFALRMQRDIWFGTLSAAALLTRLSAVPRSPSDRRHFLSVVGLTAAAVLLLRCIWELGPGAGRTASEVNRQHYPVAAAAHVREHRPPGPLFNHFNWGGYLIWELPEYPVAMDGRTNLYGEERLRRAFRTWSGEEGWDSDPDLMAAGVVIAPKKLGNEEIKLTVLLRAATERWRIVHEDQLAVVFVPAAWR